MANRLPVPGSDDNVWGEILNDFLKVAHNSDGTLSSSAVSDAGAYNKPVSGIPASDLSSSVRSSLTSADSAVQIGGDISGTSTNPSVSKIKGIALPASAPTTSGQVLTSTGTSATAWQTPSASGGGLPYASQPVTDTPEAHGAQRDGSTDDTAAIIAAINNVVAEGKANGTNYGEVWFSPGIYQVNGPLQHGSSGNAQIPLPYILSDGSAAKFTLVLKGIEDASAVWDFNNSLFLGRTVIRTNLTTGYSSTYGSPAIIGGPTQQVVGSTTSSNLLVVVDGLSIVTPPDPAIVALDFENVAEAHIGTLNINASIIPNTFTGPSPNAGGVALRMPTYWATNNSTVDQLRVLGFSYGYVPGENNHASDVVTFYCQHGVAPQFAAHAIRIDRLSTQGCQYHLSADLTFAAIRIDIGLWDPEDITINTIYHINDPSDYLYGHAAWHEFDDTRSPQWGQTPIVNGASNFKLINYSHVGGSVTAPGIPSSTTPLTNPFFRDAAVNISGGSVSEIAVDGGTTGLTSGTVIVPSGKTITLTYASTPTWNWTLL